MALELAFDCVFDLQKISETFFVNQAKLIAYHKKLYLGIVL